jgi:hypothetical protein
MTTVEKYTFSQHEEVQRTLEELEQTKTIDTVHNDEALRFLSQYAGDEHWMSEEERELVRRLDRKLNLAAGDNLWFTILRQSYAIASCSLWPARRPETYHRQPLLLLIVYHLPRLHRW